MIYNWREGGTANFCDHFVNCVNNVWRPGPRSGTTLPIAMQGSLPDLSKGHMEGNVFEEHNDWTKDNYAALDWKRWYSTTRSAATSIAAPSRIGNRSTSHFRTPTPRARNRRSKPWNWGWRADPNTISRDPEVVKKYTSDPLVHDRASLGLGKASLSAIDYCLAHAREFPDPLLLMHGTEDVLCYPSGSKDFAGLAQEGGADVTLKLWEGLHHEIHNEPEQVEVFRTMIDWLDAHVK